MLYSIKIHIDVIEAIHNFFKICTIIYRKQGKLKSLRYKYNSHMVQIIHFLETEWNCLAGFDIFSKLLLEWLFNGYLKDNACEL